MIHPIKSIIARQQRWTIKNFEKTKYSKRLKQFKDTHKGETCFIIGNGPSLKAEDLEKLYNKHIPTFGFNRIYLMFENTNWRPSYYISQDEKTLNNSIDEVNSMNIKYKFIPLSYRYDFNTLINNAYYFNMHYSDNEFPVFSNDISKEIGMSSTVACTAIQFAVYMGFKKIILIGIDHSFSTYKNEKGEIIKDDSIKDYFADEYNKDQTELYIPSLYASTRAFIVMKEYCDSHGIEIFNATRGGKLEVFPRVDFDEVINSEVL